MNLTGGPSLCLDEQTHGSKLSGVAMWLVALAKGRDQTVTNPLSPGKKLVNTPVFGGMWVESSLPAQKLGKPNRGA